MRALIPLGGALLVLALSFVSEGEGHAIIMESSPKADEVLTTSPSRLVIRFNSRIVNSLSGVTLLGPNHRQVPVEPLKAETLPPDRLVILLPPLSPGTYFVQWRVLSVDGHVTRGGFSFRYSPAVSRP